MKTLNKIARKFENMMSAIAFAEAGEFESARSILQQNESPQERKSKRLDKDVRTNLISARK